MNVKEFIRHHYRHFNAGELVRAADAYKAHIDAGGKMFVSLAGAMSTGELGLSLAEMIRQDKVHAISCTGANLEEDVFNLVAQKSYVRVANSRELSPAQEKELYDRQLNRVTDTCIPEDVVRLVEEALVEQWKSADRAGGQRLFPHEGFYRILLSGRLKERYQIDPKDSWMLAAAQKNIPIFVPGWEDSTVGNVYASHCIEGNIKNTHAVRSGIEYMMELADWYTKTSKTILVRNPPGQGGKDKIEVGSIGFFQIGGGIAGDFAICVVPMLRENLHRTKLPLWGYFCQISDAPTSYGGYSGAPPNEKITWGKLAIETPKFMIESDATIVAPLVFAHVLGW